MKKMFFVILLAMYGISQAFSQTVSLDTVTVNALSAIVRGSWVFTGNVGHIDVTYSAFNLTTNTPVSTPPNTQTLIGASALSGNSIYQISPLPVHNYIRAKAHIDVFDSIGSITGMYDSYVFFWTDCVIPLVTVSGGGVSVCANTPVTLNASGASSYTWSGNNLSATFGTSVVATPTITSTYTITGNTSGCLGTCSTTITVSGTANFTFPTDTTNICSGNSITLTAGGGNCNWSNGISNSSITVSPLTTTNYSVTITSGACSASSIAVVIVSSAVGLNLTTNGPDEFCNGGSTQLIASVSGIANDYNWVSSPSLNNINIPNPIAHPTQTTTYSVSVSNPGCTETGEITITVHNISVTSYSFVNNTMDFFGSFPINGLDSMKVWGNNFPVIYSPPQYTDPTQASFWGVIINDGDHIKITSDFGCVLSFVYSTSGIEEETYGVEVKNPKVINLLGQEIKTPQPFKIYIKGRNKFMRTQ